MKKWSTVEAIWPLARDIFLFFGGLAFAAHEVLATGEASLTVLGFAGTMMGLPLIFRADSHNGGKK